MLGSVLRTGLVSRRLGPAGAAQRGVALRAHRPLLLREPPPHRPAHAPRDARSPLLLLQLQRGASGGAAFRWASAWPSRGVGIKNRSPLLLALPPHRPPNLSPVLATSSRTLSKRASADPPAKQPAASAPPLARWSPQWMWYHLKETAFHYWHGTKLLYADTRIAAQLCTQMVRYIYIYIYIYSGRNR